MVKKAHQKNGLCSKTSETESRNRNSILVRHCKKISEHKILSSMIISLDQTSKFIPGCNKSLAEVNPYRLPAQQIKRMITATFSITLTG